jgi:hypothetical protein
MLPSSILVEFSPNFGYDDHLHPVMLLHVSVSDGNDHHSEWRGYSAGRFILTAYQLHRCHSQGSIHGMPVFGSRQETMSPPRKSAADRNREWCFTDKILIGTMKKSRKKHV